MIADRNFEHCEPISWVGSFPVYLATVMAGIHAVGVILTAIAMAVAGPLGGNPLLQPFVFVWDAAVPGGQIWRFATYAVVEPPTLWVVIQILMLAVFGTEVEKFIGRRGFLWLYLALVLAGPVLLAGLGFFGLSPVFWGGSIAQFAVFAAFAMVYPRAEIFFSLQARWVAIALLAIYSLQGLASRDGVSIGLMWWCCGVAALMLHRDGVVRWAVPAMQSTVRPGPKLRVLPKPKPEDIENSSLHESIDPILEKISRSGISSLTRDERTRLEKARARLIEKEGPRA